MNELNKEVKQVILSLDAATKTGWALYRDGRISTHGTKTFHPSEREKEFGSWLLEMIGEYEVTDIVAEDIYRARTRVADKDKAFLALAKMQGVLKYIADTLNVSCTLLNPLQVKSYMIPVFGRRERSDDKQRMLFCVKALGYTLEKPDADDEADAIGILLTYLNNKNLPVVH